MDRIAVRAQAPLHIQHEDSSMRSSHFFHSSRRSIRRLSTLILAAFAALVATSTLQAQDDELPFAEPGQDSAMIVGALGRPAQYIYPVEFIEIDGKNIYPREVMWLAPGKYELTVRAFITNPPGLRSGTRFRESEGHNRITVVVEPGKEYSIGVKYDNSEPTRPFNTVLYRVEDN